MLKIVNWNIEWRKSQSEAASVLRRRIVECDPDIVCLTEAYADFFEGIGHVIEGGADWGYPFVDGRRKVLLWSKLPWSNVDRVGDAQLPSGRFVRGRTQTELGEMDVIGVCIPWSGAHVATGGNNRTRWQDHIAYLDGLSRMIEATLSKLIVMGDYNQKVPRTIAPHAAHSALSHALLSKLSLPTAGIVEPLGIQLIDHIAHSFDLYATEVTALSNVDPSGRRLSDHFGVFVALTTKQDGGL